MDEVAWRPAAADKIGSGFANPVAVKARWHTVAELHQRDGPGLDIGSVEHRKIAAVFLRTPHDGEQPTVAFHGIAGAFDKYRLRDGIARG
jgi:hypothetical protein